MGRRRKDYFNKVIGNFKILGDTGENTSRNQKVLVKNLITNEYSTKNIQNLQNNSFNSTGFFGRGVSPLKKENVGIRKIGDTYNVRIGIDGKRITLGTVNTLSEARELYKTAFYEWTVNHRLLARKERKNDADLPKGIIRVRSGSFRAQIYRDGEYVLRKTFKTLPEAIEALEHTKQQLKETN